MEVYKFMQDKIVITLSNGTKKEITIPKYGEINFTVRNGKIANIKTTLDEKIC